MGQLDVKITGMVCSGCSDTVQKVISGIAGVNSASVDHVSGNASVQLDASADADAVLVAIKDAGFGLSNCKCTNCTCDPCLCN